MFYLCCIWKLLLNCADNEGVLLLVCVFSESEGLDANLAGLTSIGFTGCLSGVRFNSIYPLKAALLHPDSRVTVTSPLVPSSCASSSPADSYAAETTHSLSGKRSMFMSKPDHQLHITGFFLPWSLSVVFLKFYLWWFIRFSKWLIKHSSQAEMAHRQMSVIRQLLGSPSRLYWDFKKMFFCISFSPVLNEKKRKNLFPFVIFC